MNANRNYVAPGWQPSLPDFRHESSRASSDPAAVPPIKSATMKPPEEKKQITRNRTSYSCVMCRRRKIKCDKVHPICGNCAKTSEQCVYSSDTRSQSISVSELGPEDTRHGVKRRKAYTAQKESSSEQTSPDSSNDWGPRDSTETPTTGGSIESRLDRLTSLVEALSQANGPAVTERVYSKLGIRQEKRNGTRRSFGSRKSSREDITGNNPSSRYLEAPDESRIRDLNLERNASKSPVDDFEMPTSDSAELADPLSNLNLGYLSIQDGGRSRYVGSTYWAYISDELDQLNILLREQNRYISAGGMGNKECEGQCRQSPSPVSDESHDSNEHNSFHKAGDRNHHLKSQLRNDCEACMRTSFDKSVLLHAADVHPSHFRRMDPDMLKGVPSERQSHILFRCWLSGVHMHCPLIYPPVALERYERFWEWYRNRGKTNDPLPNPDFMALLYAIWYAGSVSISLRGLREWFKGTTRAALSAGFHDQITRCLTLTSFPRNSSIPTLAAYLMLQSILSKEEEPLTSSLFVGLALRVAQTMGLHRDPELFNFEPWEVECRRRLWWHIVQMDVAVAISSGLPPLINDDSYWDVKLISEIKDPRLGTPEAKEYKEAVESGKRPRDNPDEPMSRHRPSMVGVQYVAARGKFKMALATRRLLKIQLGTKPITRKDMEEIRKILAEVRDELNAIIRRIPTKGIPELGFVPDRDMKTGRSLVADYDLKLASPPTEEELAPFLGMTPHEGLNEHTVQYHWNTLAAFHKWSRIVLSLLIDKSFCVSYQPFLKNAKSKLWPPARQCALRHCHGYMRKFISLATDPAFQPFHWSWPGTHQPMHATMIMLVDLYERPNSIEAPKSRAFIDKVFSMSGPDGGIVSGEDGVSVQRPLREGGREAWDMLRHLRAKAWQKAGLDPDVLWTEDDQIRAGVAQPLTENEKMIQSLREDAVHVPGLGKSDLSSAPGGKMQTVHKSMGGPGSDLPQKQAADTKEQMETKPFIPTSVFREPAQFMPASQSSSGPPTNPTAQIPLSMPYNPISGDFGLFTIPSTNNTLPSMPPANTNTYFNPPSGASASSSTQPSDTLTKTTPSDRLFLDIHNAPSPTLAPSWTDNSFAPPPGEGGVNSINDSHFDWDQWDAVFGQHVPVDDAMDISWEDVEHDPTVNMDG